MCNLAFFDFSVFWFLAFSFVVWFLGSLFSRSFLFFLKGWHNNAKVKDLTLCQFSRLRGCKVAFGCFIVIIVCFASVLGLGPRLGILPAYAFFQNVFGIFSKCV